MCSENFELWAEEIELIQAAVNGYRATVEAVQELRHRNGGPETDPLVAELAEWINRIDEVCATSSCFNYAPAPGGDQ